MKHLLFPLIILTLFSTNTIAQSADLTGLKYFAVETLVNKETEEDVYIAEIIKTDIELKLRFAAINVIDIEQYTIEKKNAFAKLIITVDLIIMEVSYVFVINLDVYEPVTVPRLNRENFQALTWGKMHFGKEPTNFKDWQTIRQNVKDLVDKFLNAYLKDNTKN